MEAKEKGEEARKKGEADLPALILAGILPLETDIPAEALPVGEGAGAEVCIETADDGGGSGFLFLVVVGRT